MEGPASLAAAAAVVAAAAATAAEPRFRCSFCPPPPPPPPPPPAAPPAPPSDDDEDAGASYERLVLRADKDIKLGDEGADALDEFIIADEEVERGGAAASSSAAAPAEAEMEGEGAVEEEEAASPWRPDDIASCNFCGRTACDECAAMPGSAASAFVEDAITCICCGITACAKCIGCAKPKEALGGPGSRFCGILDSRWRSAAGRFAADLRKCSLCDEYTCCEDDPGDASRECSSCGAYACYLCVDFDAGGLFDGDAPAPDEAADKCRNCALHDEDSGDSDDESGDTDEATPRRVRARAQAAQRVRLLDVAIGHAAPTFAEFGDELQRLLWVSKEAYGDDQMLLRVAKIARGPKSRTLLDFAIRFGKLARLKELVAAGAVTAEAQRGDSEIMGKELHFGPTTPLFRVACCDWGRRLGSQLTASLLAAPKLDPAHFFVDSARLFRLKHIYGTHYELDTIAENLEFVLQLTLQDERCYSAAAAAKAKASNDTCLLDVASAVASYSAIERAHAAGFPFGPSSCKWAASRGNLALLMHLRDMGAPWKAGTINAAARYGHLGVLSWARDHGAPWSATAFDEAARAGSSSVRVMRFLLAAGCPKPAPDDSESVITCAAARGDSDMVMAAFAAGFPLAASAVSLAARTGNLELVQLLRRKGAPTEARSCDAAAEAGALDVLQELRRTCAADEDAQPLREHCEHCLGSPGACACTAGCARLRHSACTPQLAAVPAPAAGPVPAAAAAVAAAQPAPAAGPAPAAAAAAAAQPSSASNGDLPPLSLEQRELDIRPPVPWTSSVLIRALAKKRDAVFRWALKSNCPFDADVCCALAERGSIALLDFAKEHAGLTAHWTPRATSAAVAKGQIEVLRWVHKEGLPVDTSSAVAAAKRTQGDALQLLRICVETIKLECTSLVATAAAQRGDMQMLEFIAAAAQDESDVLVETETGPGALSAKLGPLLVEFTCGAFGLTLAAQPGAGIVVRAVAPGSLAAKLGAREGALLKTINDAPQEALPLSEVLASVVASGSGALRMLLRKPPRVAGEEPVLCAALCDIAVRRNNGELLTWALAHGVKPNKSSLLAAAQDLRLVMAQQLVKAGCQWHSLALARAFGRHLAHSMRFLTWACAEGGAKLDGSEGGAALDGDEGDFGDNDSDEDTDSGDLGLLMCAYGDAKTLRWAFDQGCPLPSGCKRAAALGDLSLLKEIREAFGKEDIGGICSAAARRGHIHVLQWAISSGGARVDEETCAAAAAGGRLDVIKFLRSLSPTPCPWDVRTWVGAARCGNVKIFEWLAYKLCPRPLAPGTAGVAAAGDKVDDEHAVCSAAAVAGHLKALQWLRAQVPPFPMGAETLMSAYPRMELLRWLRSQSPPCPWSDDLCENAVEDDEDEVLRWAAENGCTCGGEHHPKAGDDEED